MAVQSPIVAFSIKSCLWQRLQSNPINHTGNSQVSRRTPSQAKVNERNRLIYHYFYYMLKTFFFVFLSMKFEKSMHNWALVMAMCSWTVCVCPCARRCPAAQPAALILVSRLLGETQWTISCQWLPGLRADNDRWCTHPGGLTGSGHRAM